MTRLPALLTLPVTLAVFAPVTQAAPVLAADCTTAPALCGYSPRIFAYLQLSSGANSYITPHQGDQFPTVPGIFSPTSAADSDSVSYSNQYGGGSASGFFDASFSGTHTSLTASGFPGLTYGIYGVGSSALSRIDTTDYFLVGSNAPVGSRLQFTYTLDATGNTGRSQNGSWNTSVGILSSDDHATCTAGSGATNLSGYFFTTCTANIYVDPGRVYGFATTVTASASSNDAAAVLDASNTAKITSVLLVDSNGNPLPDVPLYDASGFDYNAAANTSPASPVPEPSTLALLTTGLAGLLTRLRRRSL